MAHKVYHYDTRGKAACGAKAGTPRSRLTPDREDVTCPKCLKHSETGHDAPIGHAERELDKLELWNGYGRGRYEPKPAPAARALLRFMNKKAHRGRAFTATALALATNLQVSESRRRLHQLHNAGLVRRFKAGYVAVQT